MPGLYLRVAFWRNQKSELWIWITDGPLQKPGSLTKIDLSRQSLGSTLLSGAFIYLFLLSLIPSNCVHASIKCLCSYIPVGLCKIPSPLDP